MSAQVTEAHRRAAVSIFALAMKSSHHGAPFREPCAQLIADGEAKACLVAVRSVNTYKARAERAEAELATEREKVRLLVEINEFVGAAQLAAEREKVRVLRDACESICEEWGDNYNTNPIGAGLRMATRAGKVLEAMEGAE